jgi:hypothetical protein
MLLNITNELLMSIGSSYTKPLSTPVCDIIFLMSSRDDARDKRPKYESVSLPELRQGRLGKHHELVENILRQLRDVPDGRAIKIPLNSVNGLSKANLRSALVRAASSRGTPVSTYSDTDNFYVWSRTRNTAKYERNRKRGKP